MAILTEYSQVLPPDLIALFDQFTSSITIADPELPDCPLIYANAAFGKIAGRDPSIVLGANCRFLQGPLTDRTATIEIAHAIQDQITVSSCLINYRANGEIFYNLLSMKPIRIPRKKRLIMACQFDFVPVNCGPDHEINISRIETAWLSIRNQLKFESSGLCDNDTYRLDALSMRFETNFARAQDTIIRHSATKGAAFLAELAEKQSDEIAKELRGMRQLG